MRNAKRTSIYSFSHREVLDTNTGKVFSDITSLLLKNTSFLMLSVWQDTHLITDFLTVWNQYRSTHVWHSKSEYTNCTSFHPHYRKNTHFMLFWVLSTMPARTVYGRSLDVFCWSHCTPLSFSRCSAVTQRRRVSACCVGAWPARCIQSDSFLLLALELCPAWVSSLPWDLIKHRIGFWLPTIPHKHRNKSCQSGSLQMYVHYFMSVDLPAINTHTHNPTHTHTRAR